MNKPFVPTKDQELAIASNSNMVITACPGSGKTSVIVAKIRKEIPDLDNHKGVIGITFTVKASRELKKKCKRDAFDTKASFFGTIDHFCLTEIIYPFVKRIWGIASCKLECIRYKELDDTLKASLNSLTEKCLPLMTGDYAKYEMDLIQCYRNGFLLLESVGILANHIVNSSPACQRYIKAKYVSIYVDEYQDSSQSQHQLFLTLLDLGLKAIAVGDIQQSIYAWRGGSSEYINQLISRPDVFEHRIVNINHRCHSSISNYANRLFSESASLIPTNEIRVFHRKFSGTQKDLAVALNEYIPKVAEAVKVASLSDIAVLVRNNKSLEYLGEELTVPHRIYSDDSLGAINTKASNLFADLLRYRYDPSFLINDINVFAEFEQLSSRMQISRVREKIKGIRSVVQDGIVDSILNISADLIGNSISQRDIEALRQVLSSSDSLQQYGPFVKDEVQVMTLHKSKGLEFEVVLHLDLYDWVFPFREYTGNFNEEVYPNWDQDLNLHYVGITRAKNICILIYSDRRFNAQDENRQGQPSKFLQLKGIQGLYA